VVLVLRAYLAFTFIYAGLSKIGGRSFFDPSSPASIHATLLAVRGHSPIRGLLGPVEEGRPALSGSALPVAAHPAFGDCQVVFVSITYRSTAASIVGKKWLGSMVRVSS